MASARGTGSARAVVVLAAHGSRAAAATEAHRKVAESLDALVEPKVVPAFLELSGPDIGSAIDEAVSSGAVQVSVMPYFLHPGRHLTEDLPRIVDAAARRHEGATITLLPPFGSDPRLLDVLVDIVTAGGDPDERSY